MSDKKTSAGGRKNPPISTAPNFTVREFYTGGMKLRYRAEGNGVNGPPRKSYNSAAADTHRL